MPSTQELAVKGIRLHLAARQKSQDWLATQIGVSAFYVNRRMKSETNFDTDDLDVISRAFGIGLDELLTASDLIRVPQTDAHEAVAS